MDRPSFSMIDTAEWADLIEHHREIAELHLRDLLLEEGRLDHLTVDLPGIHADLSKHRVTRATIERLVALAEVADVRGRIDAMFSGEAINTTEDRAALHVALRATLDTVIEVDGHNVVPDVHRVLADMASFCDRVRSGAWR